MRLEQSKAREKRDKRVMNNETDRLNRDSVTYDKLHTITNNYVRLDKRSHTLTTMRVTACSECRRSHVQCDGERPCKRCVKRKKECVEAVSRSTKGSRVVIPTAIGYYTLAERSFSTAHSQRSVSVSSTIDQSVANSDSHSVDTIRVDTSSIFKQSVDGTQETHRDKQKEQELLCSLCTLFDGENCRLDSIESTESNSNKLPAELVSCLSTGCPACVLTVGEGESSLVELLNANPPFRSLYSSANLSHICDTDTLLPHIRSLSAHSSCVLSLSLNEIPSSVCLSLKDGFILMHCIPSLSA